MVRRLIPTLLVVTLGCGDEAPELANADYSVRDSAGVTIIENTRPLWGDDEGWRLSSDPVLTIRGAAETDTDATGLLLDPTNVYRTADGRYVVGDGDQAGWDAVLVYDSAGQFLYQCGREGQGPGEFGQLWWVAPYRGDSVAAFDMAGQTLAVFDEECRFGREIRIPTWAVEIPRGTFGYVHGADAVFADGSVLAYPRGAVDISPGPGPVWYKHTLLRVHPDGQAWDTLGVFGISQQWWSGTEQKPYWFGLLSHTAVYGDDLYYATGEAFEVQVFDRAGTLDRVIRRIYERRPVAASDRSDLESWYLDQVGQSREGGEQVLERVRAQMRGASYAETKPALSDLLVDADGNLWVEEFRWIAPGLYGPNPRPVQWSVFDPDGRWLGDVEVPAGFMLQTVSDGYAMGLVEEEFGTERLEVYELLR